jgi:hypothetical protein
MWGLTNRTPFAAQRCDIHDRSGAKTWLVVVRGTFRILPDGATEVAPEQEPVRLTPVYFGEPGRSSLQYEADMVPTKPTTDVLLHGHAYAPGGKPAPEVTVALAVGPVRKALRAVGDRTWKASFFGPRLSEPEPFVKMPLVYERAYGGQSGEPSQREPRNPVGRGFTVTKKDLLDRPAPNVEYPGDPERPAGFGPLARDWSPRRERAGTYDAAWQEQRRPLLPEDFDDRFFQAAPDDQQAPKYLSGGEEVELVNLTPGGRLRFRMPRVALGFTTRFGRRRENHRANLHTVILEPDRMRLQLVWHTALPCHFTLYQLTDTTVYLKRRLQSVGEARAGRVT